ncbi:MAG: TolC family protein [Bacteroidota bacterium]
MHRSFVYHLFKLIVPGCLFFMTPTLLQAQPLLTLEEAMQEVLQNNKILQQARNRRRIDSQENHLIKTAFFPTLTLPSVGATWPQSARQHSRNMHYEHIWLKNEIGLSWRLAPSSFFSYQTLRIKDQISELRWQQEVAAQVAAAIKAYYGLVLAQQKQKMEVESLAVAKETLQLTKTKYEVGQETELDYLDAQVTYDQAYATFWRQEETIVRDKRAFCRQLGRDEFAAFDVTEEIPLPEPLDWETLLATYKTTSPVLLLAQKQSKNSINALKIEQADRLFPSLGLDLTYACWDKQPQYRIGLTLDFTNIFQYAINVRKERLEEENQRLALAGKQVDEEEKLRSEFLVYTQQLQDYTLQQRSVQVSQARAEAALEKYRLGSITLLALKRKQEEARRATQQCLEMGYNLKKREVELRRLAGMPLGIIINDEL